MSQELFFGWMGVLGFISQLPLKKKKAIKSMSIVQPIQSSSFFAGYLKVKVLVAQLYPILWRPHRLQLARAPCPWDFPGKNAGQSSHFLFQGIFPIQGLNPGILHCFPGGSDSKATAYNMGDSGSIPGSGRSPGEGNGNPPQYSCLENPMDGGAWLATVHGVTKSQT